MTPEERYAKAMHRMQSAVAYDIARELAGPNNYLRLAAVERVVKHLRVGLNSAMASQEGLARLLIDKGVFTLGEYTAAMTPAAEREADARVAEVVEKYSLPDGVRFG